MTLKVSIVVQADLSVDFYIEETSSFPPTKTQRFHQGCIRYTTHQADVQMSNEGSRSITASIKVQNHHNFEPAAEFLRERRGWGSCVVYTPHHFAAEVDGPRQEGDVPMRPSSNPATTERRLRLHYRTIWEGWSKYYGRVLLTPQERHHTPAHHRRGYGGQQNSSQPMMVGYFLSNRITHHYRVFHFCWNDPGSG